MDSSNPCFGQQLDMEGQPYFSNQRDKDACLVAKCFRQYFIGQYRNGEHGRKDVRVDLILVMACHHFEF